MTASGDVLMLQQLKKAQGETNQRLDRANELLAKIVEQLAYANQEAYKARQNGASVGV